MKKTNFIKPILKITTIALIFASTYYLKKEIKKINKELKEEEEKIAKEQELKKSSQNEKSKETVNHDCNNLDQKTNTQTSDETKEISELTKETQSVATDLLKTTKKKYVRKVKDLTKTDKPVKSTKKKTI